MRFVTTRGLAPDREAGFEILVERHAIGEQVSDTVRRLARHGWRIAAAYPERVAALGGFHVGGLVTDDDDSPHRSAGSIAAEVYLGFADNDSSMTREQIAELERALTAAGVSYRSEVYSGAAHGYTMADTPAYDEAAAERHYAELFALLDRSVAR